MVRELDEDSAAGRRGFATLADAERSFRVLEAQVEGLWGPVAFDASDKRFETVAALAAAVIPDAGTAVRTVMTDGFLEPGDGGGALYRYAPAEPEHSGKVRTEDGAWWELVPVNGTVNVRWFGARGDRKADDTAALQAAAEFCAPPNRYRLLIPSGQFLCGRLDFREVRFIDCQGRIISTITAADPYAVLIGAANAPTMQGGDLTLSVHHANYSNAGLEGTRGVKILGSESCNFGLFVEFFDIGVAVDGDEKGEYFVFNSIWRLRTYGCRVMLMIDNTNETFCNENLWTNLSGNPAKNAIEGGTKGIFMPPGGGVPNNNVFTKPHLEGLDAPIELHRAQGNLFLYPRLEAAGPVVFGEDAARNEVLVAYRQLDDPEYTSTSFYPNTLKHSYLFSHAIPVAEISYLDWVHRSSTPDRGYFCPKLVSAEHAGGPRGPSYFEHCRVDPMTRTWTIGSNDRGLLYVPAEPGDIYEFVVNEYVEIRACDDAGRPLPDLPQGAQPYLGTSWRRYERGTTETGSVVKARSPGDLSRMRQLRVNRPDVRYLRFEFLYGRPYKYFFLAQAVDTLRQAGGAAALTTPNDVRYIDGVQEPGDRFGQIGVVRDTEAVYLNLGGTNWVRISG